jgi:hypothetical protein
MKSLAPLLLQIFDQLSSIFQLVRHPRRSGFSFRLPQLFLTPALVHSKNRQESQRLQAVQSRNFQK